MTDLEPEGLDLEDWLGPPDEVGGPTSVYKFYDAEGRLLYVGITGRKHQRLDQHARLKTWWTDVARADFEHYPSRSEALRREAEVIQSEKPVYNIALAGDGRPRPTDRPVVNTKLRDPGRWPIMLYDSEIMLYDSEIMASLDKQARRHFDIDGEALVRAWEAGDIAPDDDRLRFVANLLAVVRVPT